MNNFNDLLAGKSGFLAMASVTNEDVINAEKDLKLSFSAEYCCYLKEYGCVSFYGHELTGVTSSKRLNVVNITHEERGLNPNVPDSFYVVEQANIDGIVIWQDFDGGVYKTVPTEKPKKIAVSLFDYYSDK